MVMILQGDSCAQSGGHPIRLQIIETLENGELCVSRIIEGWRPTGRNQPAVIAVEGQDLGCRREDSVVIGLKTPM